MRITGSHLRGCVLFNCDITIAQKIQEEEKSGYWVGRETLLTQRVDTEQSVEIEGTGFES